MATLVGATGGCISLKHLASRGFVHLHLKNYAFKYVALYMKAWKGVTARVS